MAASLRVATFYELPGNLRDRPLMPIDFNQAQAAIARGHHARVVTQ